MQKKVLFPIFILLFIFVGIFSLNIQPTSAQVQKTDISLSISPRYPKAGDAVTATLGSYVIDLNKANITWSINNEETQKGIGKKVFSFTMDKVGEKMFISVMIDTIDGQSLIKSINISSSEVDMLWEATDSYVPPFYKGKALVAKEGSFKVVAIPNIITQNGSLNPNNLSYTWKKDDNGQPNASGWGKSSFTFKNNYLDATNTIEVKTSDIQGNINAVNKINLITYQPKIIFYKKDPAFGITLQQALSDGSLIKKEGDTLVAIPYFFSPKDLSSVNLLWNWSISGTDISTPNPKNELKVKGEEGKSGSAKIKLIINNTKTFFQTAEKEINVNF